MSYAQAIVLGLVQGLAEFLPVSSSGHLVIIQFLWNLRDAASNVTFDIFLHLATLLAVVWVYRKDIRSVISGKSVGEKGLAIPKWRLVGFLLLSLIATGVILPFKSQLETQFESVSGVRIFLIINGLALGVLPFLRRGDKGLGEIKWIGAIAIGLAQAVGVFPGISRSGSTIIAGLLLGLSPREACRYSFLLSIPTIIVAALVQIPDAARAGFSFDPGPSAIAFVMAVAGGLAAIPFLIGVVEKGRLWGFAIYCVVLGIALFIFG